MGKYDYEPGSPEWARAEFVARLYSASREVSQSLSLDRYRPAEFLAKDEEIIEEIALRVTEEKLRLMGL